MHYNDAIALAKKLEIEMVQIEWDYAEGKKERSGMALWVYDLVNHFGNMVRITKKNSNNPTYEKSVVYYPNHPNKKASTLLAIYNQLGLHTKRVNTWFLDCELYEREILERFVFYATETTTGEVVLKLFYGPSQRNLGKVQGLDSTVMADIGDFFIRSTIRNHNREISAPKSSPSVKKRKS